jgi:hypothetical protein
VKNSKIILKRRDYEISVEEEGRGKSSHSIRGYLGIRTNASDMTLRIIPFSAISFDFSPLPFLVSTALRKLRGNASLLRAG